MTGPLLSALLTFNAAVIEFRGEDSRIFVGAQYAEDVSALAWTKCIPDSGVFVIQASRRIAQESPIKQRWIAAHEVCHSKLHGLVLCSGEYAGLPKARKEEIETEAERCAAELFHPGVFE